MFNITCPSCGAKLDIQTGLVSVVCKYCNTISLIQRQNIVNTGEKSFIMPFPTVFEIGKTFCAIKNDYSNDKIQNINVEYISQQEFDQTAQKDYIIKFYVYGQVRYQNDAGFEDNWFIRIVDSKINFDKSVDYVLSENEGLINIYKLILNNNSFKETIFDIDVGITINGFFVQESGISKIEGFAGSFPFYVNIKDDSKYVYLIKDGKLSQIKLIAGNMLYFQGF